ncbi:Secretion-regulating guanine nucleotide exchange factor [Leucoagaricus sp. SymC.cos]|nr:Secretion-regulating guanine nucleotide exchange factor [Leucoagaricus sp. SymC.cos]
MLDLLSAGSNAQGQLGNSTFDDSHIFQPCSFAGEPPRMLPSKTTRVIDVTNGANHTVVLLEVQKDADGAVLNEVWVCGDGKRGQLGPEFRQQDPLTVFQKLSPDSVFDKLGLKGYAVKSIAATWETTYLVAKKPGCDDKIVSFGSNEFGDLGIGRDAEDKALEKGSGVHVVDLSHLSVAGETFNTTKTVTVDKLRTGQRHVIVSLRMVCVDEKATQVLVGWGACRHGQLGEMTASSSPPGRPSIRSSRAKKSTMPSSPIYCSRPTLIWSSDTPSDFIIDFALGIHHSVFLHASGRVSVKGSDRKKQIQGLVTLQNVCEIKCSWNGTYMCTGDTPPRILSTGSNSHGQLGREEGASSLEVEGLPWKGVSITVLACGSEHSLVCLSTDSRGDEVWGWGWNEHGNLGIGTTNDCPYPMKIWPPSNVPENLEVHVRGIWGGNGSSWILCEQQQQGRVGSTP